MNILLLYALGAYVLLGIGAIIGDYSHPRLWLTKRKADPLSRTGAFLMAPLWVILTLALMGPANAWRVGVTFYRLVTTGDYPDVE